MLRLAPYGLAALIGGAAVLYVMDLRAENAALQAKLAGAQLLFDGCAARVDNLIQDKDSDDAIDAIPDVDLRNAPDGWMLPAAPGSGGLY